MEADVCGSYIAMWGFQHRIDNLPNLFSKWRRWMTIDCLLWVVSVAISIAWLPSHARSVYTESFPQQERKKRLRTKFSLEQKERMREFAEEAEWKLRKVDVNKLEKFCGEVGDNNKLTNLAKKTTDLNGNGNAEDDVGNNGCDPSSSGTDE